MAAADGTGVHPHFELRVPASTPMATKQFNSVKNAAMLCHSATIRSSNRAVVCMGKRINQNWKRQKMRSSHGARIFGGGMALLLGLLATAPRALSRLSDRPHQCAQFGRIRISEAWHLDSRGEPSLAVFRQAFRWRPGTSLSREGRQARSSTTSM